MDETDSPQTPPELLVILAAGSRSRGFQSKPSPPNSLVDLIKESITLAMSVSFEKEFEDDLAVIAYAVQQYGLPENLKLSVHSGSDKFSIYGPIRRGVEKDRGGLAH